MSKQNHTVVFQGLAHRKDEPQTTSPLYANLRLVRYIMLFQKEKLSALSDTAPDIFDTTLSALETALKDEKGMCDVDHLVCALGAFKDLIGPVCPHDDNEETILLKTRTTMAYNRLQSIQMVNSLAQNNIEDCNAALKKIQADFAKTKELEKSYGFPVDPQFTQH